MNKRTPPNIAPPTPATIKRYVKKWEETEKLAVEEKSLDKLFFQTYPENLEVSDVLVKVCTLDAIYSTHLFSHPAVARHICDLETVDERLSDGDLTLVNDIANISIKGKVRSFYSFATKYCSHHRPNTYPIYDSYVEKMLSYFMKEDEFCKFRLEDLKHHPKYCGIMREFMAFYKLEEFGFKEVDQYLWQAGKEHFPPSQKTKKK